MVTYTYQTRYLKELTDTNLLKKGTEVYYLNDDLIRFERD
jgi:hypothetical protein